jgi:hypothetical protein
MSKLRDLRWKAQDEDDARGDRWIADAFVFFYHVHGDWISRERGMIYKVWVTPGTVPNLNRWETEGNLSLGEFGTWREAASAATAHAASALAGPLSSISDLGKVAA